MPSATPPPVQAESSHVLTIDVGNTRLKWGLFDSPTANANMLASGVCFLEHIDSLAEQQWAELVKTHGASAHVLGCCVAGDGVRSRVEEQLEVWAQPAQWVISSAADCGLTNGYDHPARLGSDRWICMIGARAHMLKRLREPKYATTIGARPLVVVMVGTAVTVEAIDETGHFTGGLILPGHGIMLKSLQAGTSGLHVPTGEVTSFPTNTSDALTSGGTFAIAGAIEHMYASLQHLRGIKPWCYLTGGAGWKMTEYITVPHQAVDNLIFEGLLEMAQVRWGAAVMTHEG
jgi:type III pantothenate kinase